MPIIDLHLKPKLLAHIKSNANDKGIFIDSINCVEDHIHTLISLGMEQTLANKARLIKGESANWVNKNRFTKEKFEWQTEYFVVSVSKSSLERVRRYIANQEEHHRRKSLAEELTIFESQLPRA